MYILPQVQVFQDFRSVSTATVQNLNSFVFGPNYQLFRYAEADEKLLIGLGVYDGSVDTDFAYPNQPENSTVDTGYVSLVMDNILAQYATISGAANLNVLTGELNKLRTPNHVLVTGNGSTCANIFRTRGVRAGDRLRYEITTGYETLSGTTRVVSFEADVVSSAIAAATADVNDSVAGKALEAANLVSSGTYAGSMDTTYIVEVLNSGVFTRAVSLKDITVDAYTSELFTLVCTTGGALDGTAEFSVTSSIEGALGTIDPTSGVGEAVGSRGVTITLNDYAVSGGTIVNPAIGDVVYVEVETGSTFTTTYSRVGASNFTAAGSGTWDDDGTLAGDLLTASVDFANDWTGGNNDDVYTLICTTGGTLSTARFALSSVLGDSDTAIDLSGGATMVGTRGLEVTMTAGTFTIGDRWIIKVQGARPRIRITDAAGVDSGSTIYAAAAGNVIGSQGVLMAFNAANTNAAGTDDADGDPGKGLTVGDKYYVDVTAETSGAIKTMVLADDLPAAGEVGGGAITFQVWFYIYQASAVIDSEKVQTLGDYNWQATEDTFTTKAGIQVLDASWGTTDTDYLNVYSADMYLQYRALLSTYASAITSEGDISNVATVLGAIHPDNPLAQGVYNALLNSGDRAVYFMATPTDDLDGYLSVLNKASLTTSVYNFAPLTRSSTILAAVEAHINAMSTENRKAWRYGIFARETPTDVVVYDLAHNPGGAEYYALVAADGKTLTFTTQAGAASPYTHALSDLVVGDTVRIKYGTDAWGNVTYSEAAVASMTTNTVIKLATSVGQQVVPIKVEVWHTYTSAEIADAFAALVTSYNNRRISVVFPGEAYMEGIRQTSEFVAAAVAGLSSSVAPQQGLTNIELNGFDDIPAVYSQFNATELDTIAAGGALIVMQNTPGGQVYIRHQLTSAASEGNLNTTELSVTKNVDSISYYLAARLESYIGRYNVTPELIAIIRTQLQDGINYLGSLTGVGLLGPQLILDDLAGNKTEIVTLTQHPTFKDRIYTVINLVVPYPVNNIEMHLVV